MWKMLPLVNSEEEGEEFFAKGVDCQKEKSQKSIQEKKKAAQNPWGEGATTLEWTVPSPPNFHTFDELPKFEDYEGTEKSNS